MLLGITVSQVPQMTQETWPLSQAQKFKNLSPPWERDFGLEDNLLMGEIWTAGPGLTGVTGVMRNGSRLSPVGREP